MRYYLALFVFIASLGGLAGQAALQHATTIADAHTACQKDCLLTGRVPFAGQAPFFSYYLTWTDGPLAAEIRFTADERSWTPWQPFARFEHNPDKLISQLYFGEADYAGFELRFPAGAGYILHWAHPGTSGLATLPASPAAGPLDCPCPQPTFKDRLGWCPSGDCTEHPNPEMTEVTHLIVHHSAGANSASDWDAQVRLIWDFHVNGNGWDDIGYNWLIAPTGQLYQGRGDNIRGAHFCGHNSNTMGVCVMGNYTDIIPTAAALTTLEGLLSWKACDRDIDVLGEGYHPSSGFVVPYVAGHRDGCATACPGDSFYPLLPALREGIANRIEAGCVDLASPLILDWNPIDITSYELTWLYADTSATGFTLERGTDGTTFEPIADLPADARSFTETDFVLGNLYYYRIKAYNDDLQSGYSNTIDVNTFAVSTSSPALPAQTLRLAPNPVGETLQLQWQLTEQAPLLIILRDAQQRFVRQWRSAGTPPQTLELGHLPAGAYYLQVIQGPQQGVWPLIKR